LAKQLIKVSLEKKMPRLHRWFWTNCIWNR